MPKISIIIPAYNAGRFLAKALDSVIIQTFGDWEAIVVDDGSTDNTKIIVEDSQNKDSRIKYVYQENASQAVARNKGISLSQGEYIAFLDSDDIWLPDKLEKQMNLFEDPSVGLVYSGYYTINETGSELGATQCKYHRGNVLHELILNNFISCSSVILRKSLLEESNMMFRNGRKGVEDWDLWLRLAQHCQFDYIPEALIKYRIYKSSVSQDRELILEGILKTISDFRLEIANRPDSSILNDMIDQSIADELRRHAHWLLFNNKPFEAKIKYHEACKLKPCNIYTDKIIFNFKYFMKKCGLY